MTCWGTQSTFETTRAALQTSNPFTARTSYIRHSKSFKDFWQYFLLAARDIPPLSLKGNITPMLTEIKPGQMVKICSILELVYPTAPNRCFILQLIHKSSVPRFMGSSIQPNRMLSPNQYPEDISILLDRLQVNIISQTKKIPSFSSHSARASSNVNQHRK